MTFIVLNLINSYDESRTIQQEVNPIAQIGQNVGIFDSLWGWNIYSFNCLWFIS